MHLIHRIKLLRHLYDHKVPMTLYGKEYVISICPCGAAKIRLVQAVEVGI